MIFEEGPQHSKLQKRFLHTTPSSDPGSNLAFTVASWCC